MSLIYITNHDENIYNITKTQTNLHKKSPRYRSKFRDKNKHHQIYNKVMKTHATMGLPEEEPPDPEKFLKKHTGKPSYTVHQPEKESRPCKNLPQSLRKAKTPQTKELLASSASKKDDCDEKEDFIKKNIKTISGMKPKEPEHRIVISRDGTTVNPEKNGWEPVYIKQAIFGRTPNYLVEFNKIKEKEYQMRKESSGISQPKCRYIRRDERETLLQGLKQNWEELQKMYQGLPILTDTIPKKVRKSKLESELKQLEKDIVLVERHPYIYVYNDNDFS